MEKNEVKKLVNNVNGFKVNAALIAGSDTLGFNSISIDGVCGMDSDKVTAEIRFFAGSTKNLDDPIPQIKGVRVTYTRDYFEKLTGLIINTFELINEGGNGAVTIEYI